MNTLENKMNSFYGKNNIYSDTSRDNHIDELKMMHFQHLFNGAQFVVKDDESLSQDLKAPIPIFDYNNNNSLQQLYEYLDRLDKVFNCALAYESDSILGNLDEEVWLFSREKIFYLIKLFESHTKYLKNYIFDMVSNTDDTSDTDVTSENLSIPGEVKSEIEDHYKLFSTYYKLTDLLKDTIIVSRTIALLRKEMLQCQEMGSFNFDWKLHLYGIKNFDVQNHRLMGAYKYLVNLIGKICKINDFINQELACIDFIFALTALKITRKLFFHLNNLFSGYDPIAFCLNRKNYISSSNFNPLKQNRKKVYILEHQDAQNFFNELLSLVPGIKGMTTKTSILGHFIMNQDIFKRMLDRIGQINWAQNHYNYYDAKTRKEDIFGLHKFVKFLTDRYYLHDIRNNDKKRVIVVLQTMADELYQMTKMIKFFVGGFSLIANLYIARKYHKHSLTSRRDVIQNALAKHTKDVDIIRAAFSFYGTNISDQLSLSCKNNKAFLYLFLNLGKRIFLYLSNYPRAFMSNLQLLIILENKQDNTVFKDIVDKYFDRLQEDFQNFKYLIAKMFIFIYLFNLEHNQKF